MLIPTISGETYFFDGVNFVCNVWDNTIYHPPRSDENVTRLCCSIDDRLFLTDLDWNPDCEAVGIQYSYRQDNSLSGVTHRPIM